MLAAMLKSNGADVDDSGGAEVVKFRDGFVGNV